MRSRRFGSSCIAVLGLACVVACGDRETRDVSSAAESDPRRSESTAPSEAIQLPIPAFEWTPDPSLESIPEGPVRGRANGRPFHAMEVFFEPRFDHWALVLADTALPSPDALLPTGTESVNITDLPTDLGPGTYRKPLGPGGGFWHIAVDGEPLRTTSWNGIHAYALEITEWDVAPFDETSSRALQQAGRASGRVVVVYEGRGDRYARSWVAGHFEDAAVRYRARPQWLEPASMRAP
jgi:hypothetical protein